MIYAVAAMSGLLFAWLAHALLFWDEVRVNWVGVAFVLLAFGWAAAQSLKRER